MMDKKTMIIGLTGGIGTGKSTAAGYLISKGFGHIDADAIGRSLTADGSPMLEVLDRHFGPEGEWGMPGREILREDGSLDRQATADLVFRDAARKQRFDEIMITEIVRIIDEKIEAVRRADDGQKVLLDAPLLFEAGLESRCDTVLLIVAETDVRIRRVCERDGMSPRQVRDRIDNQMSDEEKKERADRVVDNSGDLAHLYAQLDAFIEEIF